MTSPDGQVIGRWSQEANRGDTYVQSRAVEGIGDTLDAATGNTADFYLGLDAGDEILEASVCFNEVDGAIAGVRLRMELVQVKPNTAAGERVLSRAESSSFRVNEPFRMPSVSSADADRSPLKFRVTVLSGDVTVLRNAIMAVRYRRGS